MSSWLFEILAVDIGDMRSAQYDIVGAKHRRQSGVAPRFETKSQRSMNGEFDSGDCLDGPNQHAFRPSAFSTIRGHFFGHVKNPRADFYKTRWHRIYLAELKRLVAF